MNPILLSDSGLALYEGYNYYYCEDQSFNNIDDAIDYFMMLMTPEEKLVIDDALN